MKKIFIFLAALCLFMMCRNVAEAAGRGTTDMGEGFWSDKTLQLDLDSNPSTGFTWLVVYRSDNLVKGDQKYRGSDNNAQATTGGRGTLHMEFTVTDDKDAYLVLKHARPWEEGETGAYHTYVIKTENNTVADVTVRERLFHRDFRFEKNEPERTRPAVWGKLWFVANVPTDWECESYSGEDMLGFKVRPKGKEEFCRVGYVPDAAARGLNENGKKIKITDTEYTMGPAGEGMPFRFLSNQKNICWLADKSDWQQEYFLDIIEILDSAKVWE